MIVGISYAAFQFTGTGQKANTVTTSVITMSYTESSNVISIDKALPTTDATGKVRLTEGEYFDFTLESTVKGAENINWVIAAEDVTTSSRKIDGSNIKLYLTKVDSSGNETEVKAPAVYSGKSTNWTGKVGLMYPSDYGYATSGGTTTNRIRCLAKERYNWDSSSVSDCKNNDWMYNSSKYQWTITPTANNSNIGFRVNFIGNVNNDVQPTVYLKSIIRVTSGTGEQNNPYILE